MRALKILAPSRYVWAFNGPRASRHDISIRNFAPLNKINYRVEGVTFFNPFPPRRFDLIHAFNRMPIGKTPYVIGFESHLPRAYGLEATRYFERLRGSLASNRCRRIVAISDFAKRTFLHTHAGAPQLDVLASKLDTRFPNVRLGEFVDHADDMGQGVRVAFVGVHFARKGGCVAVRLAELAAAAGVPMEVTLVSKLQMGGGIWTDPTRDGYFDTWRERLNHPSIRWIRQLPNSEALSLFERSHFAMLPTFADTFGFSAIEAMQTHCPVIATDQGALGEFIDDGRNGHLLPLETNALGEWVGSGGRDRGTARFERFFTDEVDRLARQSLERIVAAMNDPAAYRRMRTAARDTVAKRFCSVAATEYWDDLYERAVG